MKRRSKSPRPKKKPGHRSKFETEVENVLATREDFVYTYETDKFPYTVELVYNPDWTLTLPDERKIYLEAKGLFDYVERRKVLNVIRQHPEIDLRMVFMRDQKIAKNSKMRYSTWCEKHDIKYSVYPELPL